MATKLTRLPKVNYIPAGCTIETIWIPPEPPTTICTWVTKTVQQPIYRCTDVPSNPLIIGDQGGTQCTVVGYRTTTVREKVCQTKGGHSGYYLSQEVCREESQEELPALDWDGHADGVASTIVTTGRYEFKVSPAPNGVIFGLESSSRAVGHYRDLKHGLLFTSQSGLGAGSYAKVIQSGQVVSGSVTFTGADVFAIEVHQAKVKYFKGSTLIAETTRRVGGPVQPWGFLYATGDEIIDLQVTTLTTTGEVLDGAGQPGTGNAHEDGVDDIYVAGGAMPAEGDIDNGYSSTTTVSGGGMPGRGWATDDAVYMFIAGGGMPASGEIRDTSDFEIEATYIWGAGASGTGSIVGLGGAVASPDVKGMPGRGFATNVADWSGVIGGGMPGRGLAVDYTPVESLNILDIEFELVEMEGRARFDKPDTLTIDYELVSFEANTGAELEADVLYELEATATANETGALNVEFELAEMVGTATFSETATLDVEFELVEFEAYQGPVLEADVLFAFDGAATFNETGALTADVLFAFDGAATTSQGTGVLAIEYELVATGDTGVLVADVLFDFVASAAIAIPSPSETYAINLSNGAISRYSVGFIRYFRLHGKHYALADDGTVYLLDGTDDAGSDINAIALTHPSEYGTSLQKNIPKVYVDARAPNGLMLQAVVDEAEIFRYQSTRLASSNASNKPIKLKRGVKGQRWAFELRNLSGDAASVQSIEPLVEPRERKTL